MLQGESQFGEWAIDRRVHMTEMSIYHLAMSAQIIKLDDISSEESQKFTKLMKLFRSTRPNIQGIDRLGRTGFHLAAAAGNVYALQSTVELLKYWLKKDTGVTVQDEQNLPVVSTLVHQRTIGGQTALMKAAQSNSSATVYYLLKLGSNPLETDNMGRKAIDYAKAEKMSKEIIQLF